MPTAKTINRNPLLDRVALTISPVTRIDVKKAFENDCRLLAKVMSPFILYPEFDKGGRLHYHGDIWKTDNLANDLELIKEALGFIKTDIIYIDTVEYKVNNEVVGYKKLNGWKVYCTKEWYLTRKYLKLKKPINNEYVAEFKNRTDYKTDFSAWLTKAKKIDISEYK